MPELPEVETVKRYLETVMTGKRIVFAEIRRKDLRKPFPERMTDRLMGKKVLQFKRFGKYILVDLSSKETVIIHLGMSGSFSVQKNLTNILNPHDHVVIQMDDKTQVVFSDPRRFGLMDLTATSIVMDHPLLRHLGPEPLDSEFGSTEFAKSLKQRKIPIKSALLNQKVVAGLGNIYVCESLWRAKISPQRRCDLIAFSRISLLLDCIKTVLQEALDSGGSSLRNHHSPDGRMGYFQHKFSVYGRENKECLRAGCDGKIVRIVQSGRSTFYCRHCQR